jgi:hypothetical protein
VTVTPQVLFPRGVLDNVKKLILTVYDVAGEIACDEATGDVQGVEASTKKVATLDVPGCAEGNAKFCGKLEISRSATARAFHAVAQASNGDVVAKGCAQAVIDQEAVSMTIKMVRFVAPAECDNGVLEASEQCEPPSNDLVCDGACHSKEIWLSTGSTTGAGTKAGGAGDKVKPSFLWPAQTGAAGRFVAVFGDRAGGDADVAMRVMNDGLYNLADSEHGRELAQASIYLPNNPNGVAPYSPTANTQNNPVIAAAGGKYWIAFQDDNESGNVDIRMRSVDMGTLAAEQGASPLGVNGGTPGEAGVQSLPAIAAGPNNMLLVAWQDGPAGQPGRIVGRTVNSATKALGTQVEISSGTTNQRVALAGTSSGWIAVWEGGSAIKMRFLGADGQPSGGEQTVNDGSHQGLQERPSVATIDGARFAVAWSDTGSGGGDIFVQRYSAERAPIAGDQATRINNLVNAGKQTATAIAGSGSAGGMYVVAWLDEGTSHVRARLLRGDGGFLFNSVDGLEGEFQASLSASTRANPAVAIGGARPFIAIGWEDNGATRPGIYARRFPIPQ